MKKLALLTLLAITAITSFAQLPEDFNAKCITNGAPPTGGNWWTVYNPPSTPDVNGAWKCTATSGKPNGASPTPGVYCTGFYSGAHHLDTSYLVTQMLSLSTTDYPGGHVYLQFDSRKVNNTTTGRLAIALTRGDTSFQDTFQHRIVPDGAILPNFSSEDSGRWVTHEVDLSDSIGKAPFYYAFRFTSTNTASLAWYLDNIKLSEHALNVVQVGKQTVPIGIVGSTASRIDVSYSASSAGTYHISLYDMMGREVYNGQVKATTGTATYTISGLNLHPGMYCIKMGNENAYGTAKLIIE